LVKQLKLRDRDIDSLVSDYTEINPDKTLKQLEQVRYNFPYCKGQMCQGLGLIHVKSNGRKKIFLDYWLNDGVARELASGKIIKGKSKRFFMRDYDKKNFNVRSIEEEIRRLRREYGNPNNLTWDMDIEVGEQLKKRNRYTEQLGELKKYTVNQVIESYIREGMKKISKPSETLNQNSIKEQLRYLIGYNHHEVNDKKISRQDVMKISANHLRQGTIEYKTEKYGVSNVEELFKKFPAKEFGKIGFGISVYDSPLGQQNILDLDDFTCRQYLNTLTSSPGTKRVIKESLSAVWKHAIREQMLGKKPPQNPLELIDIERPTHTAWTKYDTAEFTQQQLNEIYWKLEEEELQNKYLFQTDCIQLSMFSGRRTETLLNLNWDRDIVWDEQEIIKDDRKVKIYGQVNIPAFVNKTEKADKFIITNNINLVIQSMLKKRQIHSWTKYVGWMFPSSRTPNKHQLRKGNENTTEESRMKGVRGLWDLVCEELELKDVAMKMFRNTFDNKVNETEESKSSFDTITITGHARTETLDSKYLNKKFTPKGKAIATSVDEEYENIIKIRKIK
jgi:hypothetical protein|tara:strand:+ start:1968 stop:3650 length:1683 start_codon:yes stop_codon:yes gene_type:complete